MTLIIQSPLIVGRVLSALEAAADNDVTEVRLAIAYVTVSGVKIFTDTMANRIPAGWPAIPKRLITCIDFGFTDPDALRAWLDLGNATVLLHNTDITDARLRPQNAFHSKYYEFRRANGAVIVAGSANLSQSALTRNFEAMMHTAISNDLASADSAWDALSEGAKFADETLISAYARRRAAIRLPIANAVYATPSPGPRLWDAIETGEAQPESFSKFWVDTGSMTSGGSFNQLELPRGGHQFFGGMVDYSNHSKVIIKVKILNTSGPVDRPISWHGSNKMERINLPTNTRYANRVALFKRSPTGFTLKTAISDSPEAQSWVDRSSSAKHYFKIGGRSPRRCGFFN